MVDDVIARTTRRMKNLTPQMPGHTVDSTVLPSTADNSSAIVNGSTSQSLPPVETIENADDVTVESGLLGSRTSADVNITPKSNVTVPSLTVPDNSLESSAATGTGSAADRDFPALATDVSLNFKEILSKVPTFQDEETLVVNKEKMTVAAIKSDEDKLLDKIMQASKAGDRDTAELLCRLYGRVTSSASLKPPTNLSEMRSVSSDAGHAGQQTVKPVAKSLVYVAGALAGHMEISFTPFFDKALRILHGIIPLTIFDKAWQERCMNNNMFSDKKKSEERNGEYVGYTYPNKWTQSYAKWNGNHRNFLITIRDVYKHDGFVPWLIAHKGNVDQIVSECGFLTGFRYDILVRQNAFAFPVPQPDGSQSVPDISVFRTDIKDKVYELTRRLDELEYANNPYAYNCQKYNWDPTTGKPKSNKNKTFDNPGIQEGSGGSKGRSYRGRGDWTNRNDQGGGDYNSTNNNQTSWNDGGNDNGWGQKRKADTTMWGGRSNSYRGEDYSRKNVNPSAGSTQGPPRYNNKKDNGAKTGGSGKDTIM
ncbi:hypothetical protein MJO29_009614 [Puccinia striiformis f. sp. tritici]|nr:hypothetical protein Pst134EB_018233 [Puccinia striiformis f. sp. tritici]KAI7950940.1 hypothetical protein MJO29_009614 [Puccinia striiformis f. sp. tritici]